MLTRIALFNSAAMFLDQLAIIIISLIITPIIVATLGVPAFGVWQLLLRGSTYVSFFDGRPHETLKWQIAKYSSSDFHKKRQLVGAGIIIWFTYLPLLLGCSAIFIFWVIGLDNVENSQGKSLLIAALLMACNAIFVGVRTFPEAVLKGENKGYKQIGVRLVFLAISGVFSILSIKMGYGLAGLATVQVLTTVLMAVVFFGITKKNVKWLGVEKPEKKVLNTSYQQGVWYFLWSIVNFGLLSIDILILGIFATTDDVSHFVITFYAILMITTTISTALSAMLPGLGALIGRGEYARAIMVHKESILYSWWLAVAMAATVLFVNQSFVELWVDKEVFAGHLENVLIVFMALQMVFIRNNSLVINVVLDQKEKVIVSVISLIVTIVLAAFLVPIYGIVGLCVSTIIGRSLLNYKYPKIISNCLRTEKYGFLSVISLRGLLLSILLLISSASLCQRVHLDSWISLVALSGLLFISCFVLLYYIGFTCEQKNSFTKRIKLLVA